MLNELELKVIDGCKVWGTSARHACIIMDYENFKKSIEDGKIPDWVNKLDL
jgi:hypothetical protein|tara:strand:+ start:74 stop:226 length:153 start_codon:yes stop_codon:yes gene_type:complete